MSDVRMVSFEEFLELSEVARCECLVGKLKWWQKIYLKAWFRMKENNPGLRAKILWESMMKGRF